MTKKRLKRIMFALIVGGLISGCQSVKYEEFDAQTGKRIKYYEREGFINWSDGEGKVMPFGNISISAVNAGGTLGAK